MTFIDRFREALRIPTAWPEGAAPGDTRAEAPLRAFQAFLAERYPAFHKAARRRVLSPYSVLYRWPGSGGAGALPALLLGHYDVVPAEAPKWTRDPFGAELREEDGAAWVYGRGALDMKSMVAALLEAAEEKCRAGFVPQRDIWFAFGGDEERTGALGARNAAAYFAEEGIRFEWILDEGGPVAEDQVKGVSKAPALVGIEEKGFLSVRLSVRQGAGHASAPPDVQAVAVLARALLRVGKRPFPWRLVPTARAFFAGLGAHTTGARGFVMRHAALAGPLFFKAVSAAPSIAALLRTTTAMTQLSASPADNVMPSEAAAVLNLRLLPPWTVASALERLRAVIADDRVTLSVHGLASDPVPAAPGQERMQGPAWDCIRGAIGAAFPDAPVIPFLMTATTDSRHYHALARQIFRFNPQRLNPGELARMHGHDERISVANLERGLTFYRTLLESGI
ncbi:MAG: M20/M25/M40 family metallo-hydrolase [Treponema sp.]|jgi:carboxypeptidase PM20D1|nr:M20/M25/M40 family metallo-hydrolase [Treponema sp.]